MKFARGTPWGFIALNGLAAVGVVALGLYVVTRMRPPGAPGFPSLATDYLLVIVSGLAIEWFDLLLFFFRDPDRKVGKGVVSPADGKVREATAHDNGAKVSVFLRPSDVHVVRTPIAGRVASLQHKPGGKRFAFSKDSHLNERLEMRIQGESESCALTLIAGAFADRIVAYVAVGDTLSKGDRIGIIKFGSRVDVEYKSGAVTALAVKVASTVKAGETTIIVPAGEAPQP